MPQLCSREAHPISILLIAEALTNDGPSGSVRLNEAVARRRLLGTTASLLLSEPYALARPRQAYYLII